MSADVLHAAAQIIAHTLADTRPGSIVVLHITGGDTAPLTAAALPRSCVACAPVDCAQSPSPNCSSPT